jgi:hypothetical protein
VHISSDYEPGVILHSYKKSFNGFVMKLTEDEAETMAGNNIHVFSPKRNIMFFFAY